MSEKMWFFERNGQQHGPVPERQLQQMLASNELPSNSLVWSEHLTDWTQADSIESFGLVTTTGSQAKSFRSNPSDVNDGFNSEQTKEFATNYFAQVKEILTNPRGFFDSMPLSGGLTAPMTFFAASLGVFLVGNGIVTMNLIVPVVLAIMFPISVYLGGMLVNFIAISMGGRGTLEGTLRVYCYAYATLIAAWVPIIGIFASFYSWYLFFLGFKRVHQLDTGKTIVVIIVAGVIAGIVVSLGACGAGLVALVGAGMLAR